MPDKAWKKRERDVAQYFNGTRTPLSGGNGKVTRADVIHDEINRTIGILPYKLLEWITIWRP